MNLVKIKVEVDASNVKHVQALNDFLNKIGDNDVNGIEVKDEEVVSTTKNIFKEKNEKAKAEKTKVKTEVIEETEEVEEVAETTITTEDVRAIVKSKSAENREAIKDLLSKYGANNVTSLDKKNYEGFVSDMKKLS